MKKTMLFLCCLLVLNFVGCSKAPNGTQSPADADAYGLHSSPEDMLQACSLFSGFLETPEGCYYIYEEETMPVLFFCPRGGEAFLPLCGKPNCEHKDENCSACVGLVLGYYDGALYSAEASDGLRVIKMNLDGTDHRIVAQVDFTGLPVGSYTCAFHRGKLFVLTSSPESAPMEEWENHLLVLNLADLSQTELAEDILCSLQFVSMPYFYKDTVFLAGTEKGQEVDPNHGRLIALNTVTGEAGELPTGCETGFYATDTTLYYFLPDVSRLFGFETANPPGFREYDRKSGTVKNCGLPTEDIFWARYDENYIYAQSLPRKDGADQTFYFLSRDYEIVDQIDLQGELDIAAVTSDRVYFFDNVNHSTITCYLDKSAIGNHNLKLQPINTAVSSTNP